MTYRTKFITTLTLVALATTGLTATTAVARGERMTPPSFSELDMDGNGTINRADMTAFAAARFASADTDGNGTLSPAELQAQSEARAAERGARMGSRMINQLDADGDGALSLEELQARGDGRRGGGQNMLGRADTNGDGAVSEAEYTAALEKMREGRGQRDGTPRQRN